MTIKQLCGYGQNSTQEYSHKFYAAISITTSNYTGLCVTQYYAKMYVRT